MVDSRFVEYVRANKDQHPLESIKAGLAKAGLSAGDIEEAVRLATESAPPAPAALAPAACAAPGPGAASFSHPDRAVRHSYPIAAADDGFTTALGLYLKTLPFVAARMGLLVGFTLAAIVWYCLTLLLAGLAGKVAGGLGAWTMLIGMGLPAGAFFWFRRYVLYMLKMGHVAVLTRLITHGELPAGVNQVEYGKAEVAARFGQASAMFALDAIVKGVARAFINTVEWVAHLLPIPGLSGPLNALRQIAGNATSYVDETIFSYALARGDENPWRSSRDGLIYYAQNWKPVLKTALLAWALEQIFSFLAFLAFLLPAYLLAALVPALGGWAVLIAALFAINAKSGLFRPLLLTMVALSFHKAAQNQPIDARADDALSAASEKFRQLGERARGWTPQAARAALGAPALG